MLDKKNPPNKIDKIIPRVEPELTSDNFGIDEQKKICQMVIDDGEIGRKAMADWVAEKELNLKQYNAEKPSILEGLIKKPWQSDRNLGLAPAVADSYQATLLATCYTPDTINFISTELQDIDTRSNQVKFVKWGLGKQEANFKPEVDDYIHNKTILGFSCFKIYWKVWYEWIDRRIPKKDKDGKTTSYEIKTEKCRFEKGVIENICDIDDIILPSYSKSIQDLPFFIQVIHINGSDIIDYGDRNIFQNVDDTYKKSLKNYVYEDLKSKLGIEKLKELGITVEAITDNEVRNQVIDLYEWYGKYKKGNRVEKYRFIIDPLNRVFLAGKPLRKITRTGRLPFVGGPLIKKVGTLRGKSLMTLVAPIINAFNNAFNQKSDFQYVENCPFGFHNPEEGYQQQVYELEPGKSYPVNGDPSKSVYFPNLSRSQGWAESDFRILLEMLERLTGAASYFQSRQNQSPTLGQDLLIDKNSETRFGLWVSRIIEEIAEAIAMWFQMYQDWAPKNLGERVLGEDGKALFPNLSVETLRGQSSVQMQPDVVAGSKQYRKQLQLWAFMNLQQSIWLNPQVNPKGNWNLTSDTLKEVLGMNDTEIRRWIGKEPKSDMGDLTAIDNEWERFMQGDEIAEPPEGQTAMAMQHLIGHMKQKEEKYQELDEEYRPNFDAHIFKTAINYQKFMQEMKKEQMANQIASNAIMTKDNGAMPQSGAPGAPPMPGPGAPTGAQPPIPGGPQAGQPPMMPGQGGM